MGGGGQTGGTVVQSTAPWAADLAGQYGSAAAAQAGAEASASMQEAIKAINTQYVSAAKTMQPYTQEGVQALNKLNSYLQLNAYNPGNAPTLKTLDELKKGINSSAVRDYILNNSILTPTSGTRKVDYYTPTDAAYNYSGVGSYDNRSEFAVADAKNGGKGNIGQSIAGYDQVGPGYYGSVTGISMNLSDKIKTQLAQDQLDALKPQYELDKSNYDFAKAEYDKYQAQGPMTAEQIANDITNQPGYQAELTQGIDAIQKAASSRGYVGSGRILKELNSWGQNTLSTYYGNTLNRLAALAGSGQQAATTVAGLNANQGNNLASLYSSLADTKANATLAGAKARSEALIAGNQRFDVIGQQSTGGGGIGQALGAIGSIASAFSAKHLKEDFKTINTQDILDKVNQLDIEKWKYKGINVDHIGPYAGQFKEVFGVGDGQSINLIDAVGISLAANQELTKRLKYVLDKVDMLTTKLEARQETK
jgi:hypothetical protein